MRHLLLIAARSLLQHRRRNLLLGMAIAIVTMLLVLLLGLSGGVSFTMLRAATTLSSGHVNVGGFFKITSGNPAPVVTKYHGVEDVVRKALPDLDYLIDRTRGWGKIVSPNGSLQAGVHGVDISRERGLKEVLRLAEQREYVEGGAAEVKGNIEDLAKPGTILIFAEQAKRLGVDVGDELTLSTPTLRGVNNTADMRIVAVAKNIGFMSSWSVFVPHQVVRDIYQMADDATGVLQIYLKGEPDLDRVETDLRKALADAGYRLMEPDDKPFFMLFERVKREDWTGQKLDVTTWHDEVSFMSWTLTALDTLTVLLVGILMVLVMVGIMNTLWIAIRERTREIGTLRAIGMGRRGVLAMFLIEALFLGFLATLVGAGLGYGISAAVNAAKVVVPNQAFQIFTMSETLWLLVDPAALVKAVAVISFLTMLAALYPAYRATRLKPISAIHHIG